MVDFRYHLVSLISVFLALAVGIVLGAGPLRENLGDQLTGQVEQLRTEQDELRTQNEQLGERNEQLSSFISEAGPQMVAGALQGKRIAVITDSTSTRPALEKVSSLLDSAGAEISTRITLQSTLWDPSQETQRQETVDAIRETAPEALQDLPTTSEQLSALMIDLLSPQRATISKGDRGDLWKQLVDGQIVTVDGQDAPLPDAILLAAADPAQLVVAGENEAQATNRSQLLLQIHSALASQMSATELPVVIAGTTPGNDSSTSILRTVRGDSRFSAVSTTDRLQESDGALLAVLALIEQTRDGEGDYGTAADADARLPELPETATVPTSGNSESAEASDGGGEQ